MRPSPNTRAPAPIAQPPARPAAQLSTRLLASRLVQPANNQTNKYSSGTAASASASASASTASAVLIAHAPLHAGPALLHTLPACSALPLATLALDPPPCRCARKEMATVMVKEESVIAVAGSDSPHWVNFIRTRASCALCPRCPHGFAFA
ncbi:hypothetical protein ACJQWK_11265 [Exserohilum turcicum]